LFITTYLELIKYQKKTKTKLIYIP